MKPIDLLGLGVCARDWPAKVSPAAQCDVRSRAVDHWERLAGIVDKCERGCIDTTENSSDSNLKMKPAFVVPCCCPSVLFACLNDGRVGVGPILHGKRCSFG